MKNRIKELREKNNLTLKGLGKKVGLADNTLSQYETGKRHPKFEIWQKLADFFGVSVPYLQGYVEINIPNDLKFDSKQDAIDCIEKIMKALDISKEDLRTEHENEFKKS
ncbi:helix-turn-helix domain-containing protein [Lactobacillus amylovorus]|uniref:helix-turn-helix domain-containing protein n=1 Tax=Lactobacillus amylovorus TaxID=1604 RepID=UPI00232C9B04|nr:helix-turn-helix transcriptional regulator [Lactobacillus amylovorus]MDB6253656.1 helix-turn-helix domain-containing protein [Lactobacillus amylovorus]